MALELIRQEAQGVAGLPEREIRSNERNQKEMTIKFNAQIFLYIMVMHMNRTKKVSNEINQENKELKQ